MAYLSPNFPICQLRNNNSLALAEYFGFCLWALPYPNQLLGLAFLG